MTRFRTLLTLGSLLLLLPLIAPLAQAQTTGTPVPSSGAPNTLVGPNAGAVGSGANNSVPSGGPGLTGTPRVKTKKRHNRHMYGKHYNVMKHSRR